MNPVQVTRAFFTDRIDPSHWGRRVVWRVVKADDFPPSTDMHGALGITLPEFSEDTRQFSITVCPERIALAAASVLTMAELSDYLTAIWVYLQLHIELAGEEGQEEMVDAMMESQYLGLFALMRRVQAVQQ